MLKCFLLSFHLLDLDDPEGLAYDWIHKRLYFTDYYNRSVQSMGIDGQNRSLLHMVTAPEPLWWIPAMGKNCSHLKFSTKPHNWNHNMALCDYSIAKLVIVICFSDWTIQFVLI